MVVSPGIEVDLSPVGFDGGAGGDLSEGVSDLDGVGVGITGSVGFVVSGVGGSGVGVFKVQPGNTASITATTTRRFDLMPAS